jgi:AraC-like DNA-binding protein
VRARAAGKRRSCAPIGCLRGVAGRPWSGACASRSGTPLGSFPRGRPSARTSRVRAIRQTRVVVPPVRHLLRAKDLADSRYFQPLTVADLARAAGLSPSHFSREFRRAFGEAPHQYLLTRRLERAAALLRNTDRSVTEICFTVGLSSVGSFTSSFHRVHGTTPIGYRSAFPPARRHIRVPSCVAQAYGRPKNRTFGEATANVGS